MKELNLKKATKFLSTKLFYTYTNLFEIIEDRSDFNSTIITSQLPVLKCYDYLNNDTVALRDFLL